MKKWILALTGIFLMGGVIYFYGCEETPGEGVEPPTNLTVVVAGIDSLSLKLEWFASSTEKIDGYIVYFNNSAIDTVITTSFICTPTALGDYKVTAYKDDDESGPSNTASTKLVEDPSAGPVYWTNDTDSTHHSGFGWTLDGTGQTYRVGPQGNRYNTDKIDFVLDSDLDIRDPDNFDSVFEHETGIAYNASWTYSNVTTAPQSGYLAFQATVYGATYVLWVQEKYYVKLTIGSDPGNNSITFKYGFQKTPGFRRLG